jgi:hypothetical protein
MVDEIYDAKAIKVGDTNAVYTGSTDVNLPDSGNPMDSDEDSVGITPVILCYSDSRVW